MYEDTWNENPYAHEINQEQATAPTMQTNETVQAAQVQESAAPVETAQTAQTTQTYETAQAAQAWESAQTAQTAQAAQTESAPRPTTPPMPTYGGQYSAAAQGQTPVYTAVPPEPAKKKGKAKKAKKEKKKGGVFGKLILACFLGLFFGIFACAGFLGVQYAANLLGLTSTQTEATTEPLSNSATITESVASSNGNVSTQSITVVQSDVTQLVENVMPAMVSIINNYTVTSSSSSFFGQSTSYTYSACGTGIIIGENDDELLIVTNYHVIEDADELLITFYDEETYSAQVKGTDEDLDLAVLAVQKADVSSDTMSAITIATLGDSDALKLGEQVVAIGNALGYGQSVTVGYVSALNREISSDDGVSNAFIQTDAAINPGNSGGALINMNGEVIGINSSKIGGSTVEGIGFAIPISSVIDIIDELVEHKTMVKVDESEKGYLGIAMQNVTSDVATLYNMPEGVYIYEVYEDTPAEAAGLQAGDIITAFDGQSVTTYTDIQTLIQYYAAGETVTITVQRFTGGSYTEMTFTATLTTQPATSTSSSSSSDSSSSGTSGSGSSGSGSSGSGSSGSGSGSHRHSSESTQ